MEEIENLKGNPDLSEDYDVIKQGDEKVGALLNMKKGSFILSYDEDVDFDDISFAEATKESRKETYLGLLKSVSEMGIVNPIHLMMTESYSDWLSGDMEEEFNGFKYIVIDGFRRIYSGVKNGLTSCHAVIWDFEDKDLGSQLITPLSLLLNKNQKHSWNEVWYLFGILELTANMSPGTLEYLLQLESGDAMKLKDIMTCDYPEVRDELLGNKKTLTQCYNMLQKLRKEEDQLAKEDTMGISEVETAEEIIDKEGSSKDVLSDDEVREILDMSDNFDGDLSEEDFDALMGNDIPDDRQTVGERHPLDPALRKAVLTRDGYCCAITGMGKGLPMEVALSILNVHHKIPVHCGGTDTMDNLITVCQDVHTLIHIIERRNGKLGMSKEDFDNMDEHNQEFIKGVMKVARIAVEANRRVGNSSEKIKKETADSIRFKMPGTDLKTNMDAMKS